ncbi:DUF3987 domain-containing protein [Ahrensia sp. R2A130]|uniref:DUF3987 domain-containing protein n=1 Tax=Ahrensia sp. R2A130 TaxID=744979 RepID=UPI0001E0C341|nr:DUF3987 domain-containing protein [Ahrensia sp. R2A130]EFL89464.1 hypothetical protein R2A130_3603 [Ahrensia sp. R2A130]
MKTDTNYQNLTDPASRADDNDIDWGEVDFTIIDPNLAAVEFPLHALPAKWAKLIRLVAESTGICADYIFTALVTCVAILIGNRLKARIGPSWIESASIWSLLIGRPGNLKSALLSQLVAIIGEIERDETPPRSGTIATAYRQNEIYRDALLAQHKRDVRAAVDAGGPPPEMSAVLRQVIEDNEPAPTILVGAGSFARTFDIASTSKCGIGIINGEAGQIFTAMGSGGLRQMYLNGYSGGSARVSTRAHGDVRIDDVAISILAGIQPDAVGDLKLDRDDGVAGRFLFCLPKPDHTFNAGSDGQPFKVLSQVISSVRSSELAGSINLTDEALANLADRTEAWRRQAMRMPAPLSSAYERAHSNALRLAMSLAVLDHVTDSSSGIAPISSELMTCALDLMETYYLPVAKRVLSESSVLPEIKAATFLAYHLLIENIETFNARKKRHELSGLVRDAKPMRNALTVLEQANIVRQRARASNASGPTPLDFVVNPSFLAKRQHYLR